MLASVSHCVSTACFTPPLSLGQGLPATRCPALQINSTSSRLSSLPHPRTIATMSQPQSNPPQTQSAGNRTSTRMSTYSATPTLTPSIAPSHLSDASTSGDPKSQDIKTWNAGFDRLEDKRLVQQRYIPSDNKTADMSKLALGAKVQRALDRRMSSQDAVFTNKGLSEKKIHV